MAVKTAACRIVSTCDARNESYTMRLESGMKTGKTKESSEMAAMCNKAGSPNY